MSSDEAVSKVASDSEERILPKLKHQVSFVEHTPSVCGRPLEQRVWIVYLRLEDDLDEEMLKRIRTKITNVMDFERFFDPFWRIREGRLTILKRGKSLQIVMDTIMSRPMRSGIMDILFGEFKKSMVKYVALTKRDETQVYAPKGKAEDSKKWCSRIVMSYYKDRADFLVDTKEYPDFSTEDFEEVVSVRASGTPQRKQKRQKIC